MASGGSSEYDELSEYSYASSERTASVDTVDELLSRFTLDCHPDCTLKLRNKLGPVVVGADLIYSTSTASSSGNLVVKPSDASAPWRRLKVNSTGTFTLRSRKLSWWVLTLDLHGHVNPFKRTTDLSFRVATKWDISSGEIRKKKLFPLGEGAEARVHWNVNYNMPSLEGSLGTEQARDFHADPGYAHFSIPKVELVVWPDQLRARAPASSSSSAAAVAAAAEGEESSTGKAGAAGAGEAAGSGGGGGSWRGGALAAVGAAALQRRLPWQRTQHAKRGSGSSGIGGGTGSVGSSLGAIQLDSRNLQAHIFQLVARRSS